MPALPACLLQAAKASDVAGVSPLASSALQPLVDSQLALAAFQQNQHIPE